MGGFWSSAFGYRCDDRELVFRLGHSREGYDADRGAGRFAGPDLPIPEVHDIGEAFGGFYAISERQRGHFIEEIGTDSGEQLGATLYALLTALRSRRGGSDAPVFWYAPDGRSWRDRLSMGIDDVARRQVGATPAADVFDRCVERINSLREACPERRDLLHADLFYRNVLVSDRVDRVSGIFSWKCSAFGDFLYDLAWCTFWSRWYPVIESADMWTRFVDDRSVEADMRVDAPIRHHVYELHIGATHLAWWVKTHEPEHLARGVEALEEILERGPRAA